MRNNQVLIRPLVTEKSMKYASQGGYTFLTVRKATKPEIKKAVEEQFKVKALAVKTINLPGKTRRVGRRRQEVKTRGLKKAIVYLSPGQKLDIFEFQEQKE